MTRNPTGKQTRQALTMVLLIVVVVGVSFAVARGLGDRAVVVAGPDIEGPPPDVENPPPMPEDGSEPTMQPTPTVGEGGRGPTSDVTPEPGATPDTTQSWWAVPYKNADRQMPVEVLTLNGITVGPGVERIQEKCPGGLGEAPLEDAMSSRVGIDMKAIPAGAVIAPASGVDGGVAITCGDRVIFADIWFTMEPDRSVDFFGGWVHIARWIGSPQVASKIPAYRWSEETVGGQPAAVARPILPEYGTGSSMIFTYEDGVATVLSAHGIPLAMLHEIAREVLQ